MSTGMILDVAPKLLELGLSTAALVARNVDNTRTAPELIAYRRAVGRKLAAHWKNRSISAHPAIREYHKLHQQYGADDPPAPEQLITYVRRNRDFTASGAVVDCYNIVSARTLLSIGAHDLNKLSLPITLRAAEPRDTFIPLGETEAKTLSGEYAYVDSQGSVICRLDVLQCEHTKTTRESRDVAFFLQGNRSLPPATLLKGAWLLSEMVTTFCGGSVELVSFIAAEPAAPAVVLKPQIGFETFKHLNLQKATVLAVSPLPNSAALSAVTVQAKDRIEALVPSSALAGERAGQEVVVATDLHPLVVAGKTFSAYVPSLHRGQPATVLEVETEIPNGERLH
jgi:DNA/RNA-binding domain of Phe-tRNA-synthetase-like protein